MPARGLSESLRSFLEGGSAGEAFFGGDDGRHGRAVVTLVVAHPDDECMFFAPAMARLGSSPPEAAETSGTKVRWTVLCLSNGNAYGLGKLREKELYLSCETLKIPRADVEVVDDPELQDGMEEVWDPRLVAAYIRKHVSRHGTTHLVGFDERGISGHPNHCACSQAMRIFSKSEQASTKGGLPVIWMQQTFGGLGQYGGLLCALLCKRRRRKKRTVTCVQLSCIKAFLAMKQHRSQLVWYRYLHLIFSRYVYINVLQKM